MFHSLGKEFDMCQSAYHRNDYKYYFYEIHTSISTFLGNRFSVKRKKKLVRLQVLFFTLKGHMPDCITILMMFVLTKQKCGLLWQVMSPFAIFALSFDISHWNINNFAYREGKRRNKNSWEDMHHWDLSQKSTFGIALVWWPIVICIPELRFKITVLFPFKFTSWN